MRAPATPSVLLDATALPADRGGVGRYVDDLVPALIAAGLTLTVVCKPSDAAAFEASGARTVGARTATGGIWRRLIWEQFALPILARRLGVDVIHSVHYTFPLVTRIPRVVTVHDLTFFTHPELHSTVKGRFFRFWIRLAARRRITVVTPSAATAGEFQRLVRGSEELVHIALLGYDGSRFHPPTDESVSAFAVEHGVHDRRWIAFLGTLEPRKNVPALIRGFTEAFGPRTDTDRPSLLLAGGRGWDPDVAPSIAAAAAAGLDVRALGYLPVEQLSALLGGAEVVAYPSLGEGFGLPVLEAMACGSCVLTTKELSLPEVGGEAVAYTGTAPEDIGRSLLELDADEPRRSELANRALHRSAEFTWDRCAAAHLDAYLAAVHT